ncbi:transposable element Tcb2 transposase [Trichonephila clavipes]|nr:transposable element Tcb2 transposase [Trichonephila clavipes]
MEQGAIVLPGLSFEEEAGQALSKIIFGERGVGTSGSERHRLNEDQAQNALNRPVVERTRDIHTETPSPLRLLLLTHTHRHLRLQRCHARGNWTAAEWNHVVFSNESRFNLSSDGNRVRVWRPRGERINPAFSLQRHTAPTAEGSWLCLQHQHSRIGVWRLRGERTLAACIRHRRNRPLPGMMVWRTIRYTSFSHLICIDGTLNSAHYISLVLRPAAVPFIRALSNPMFQQDNARPYATNNVQTFRETENVRPFALPCNFSRSSTNIKRLVHVCRATFLSTYTTHYG